MTTTLPIGQPADYVTQHVVAFGVADGLASPVDAANPLPVRNRLAPAQPAPLAGTAAASATVGPFVPELGRTIWVTLSGSWTGSVQLLRSVDGDVTRLALTVAGQPWAGWTGNANEPVGEETVAGASYWLAITLASGTVTYRVQQ